jgi:hypothetical protein
LRPGPPARTGRTPCRCSHIHRLTPNYPPLSGGSRRGERATASRQYAKPLKQKGPAPARVAITGKLGQIETVRAAPNLTRLTLCRSPPVRLFYTLSCHTKSTMSKRKGIHMICPVWPNTHLTVKITVLDQVEAAWYYYHHLTCQRPLCGLGRVGDFQISAISAIVVSGFPLETNRYLLVCALPQSGRTPKSRTYPSSPSTGLVQRRILKHSFCV